VTGRKGEFEKGISTYIPTYKPEYTAKRRLFQKPSNIYKCTYPLLFFDARVYGQRAQSETVNSMIKRNLGDCLRSIKTTRRKQEMLLRTLTHNLMLGHAKSED